MDILKEKVKVKTNERRDNTDVRKHSFTVCLKQTVACVVEGIEISQVLMGCKFWCAQKPKSIGVCHQA